MAARTGTVTYSALMVGNQEIYNGSSAKTWAMTREGNFPSYPYYIKSAKLKFSIRTVYSGNRHMVVSRVDNGTDTKLGDVATTATQANRDTYQEKSLSTTANYVGITTMKLDGVDNWACQLWSGSYVYIIVQWEESTTACTAPTSVSLSSTVSEGNATLNWSGAAAGVNNAITGYIIQYRESTNGTSWGSWTDYSEVGTVSSASVAPSSTRGSYRQFRVMTKGAAGSSYYSGWTVSSNSVRKNTLPSNPSGLSASPSLYESGNITLSWTASTDTTGTVSGYKIQYRTKVTGGSYGSWTDDTTTTGTSITRTPTLARGAKIQYRIAAYDSYGAYSDYVEFPEVTKNSLPGTPGSFAASTSVWESGSIKLTWNVPTDADGNLDHYVIAHQTSSNGASWGTATDDNSNIASSTRELSVTPPSLTRGHYVRYSIIAVDKLGASSSVAYATVRKNTLPSVPSNLSISPTLYESGNITASWDASTDDTGTVVGYEISYRTKPSDGSWSAWITLGTYTETSITRSPTLDRGTTLQYRIRSKDSLGVFSDYATFDDVVRNNLPDAPGNFSAAPALFESERITLAWNAPTVTSGTLDHYELKYRTSSNGSSWGAETSLATTKDESYVTSPPAISRGYWVQYMVRAVDTLGAVSSWALTNARRNSAPEAPENLTISPDGIFENTTLTITWPASIDVDNNVSYYQVAEIVGDSTIANRAANDGNIIADNLRSLSLTFTSSAQRGQYARYAVRAVDAKGVQSSWRYIDSLVQRNRLPLAPRFYIPVADNSVCWATDPRFSALVGPDPDLQEVTGEARITSSTGTTVMAWKQVFTVRPTAVMAVGFRCGVTLPVGTYRIQLRLTDSVGATAYGSQITFTVEAPSWYREITPGTVISKQGDYARDGIMALSSGLVTGKTLTLPDASVAGTMLVIEGNTGISHQADQTEMLNVINIRRLWYGLPAVEYTGRIGYFADWIDLLAECEKALTKCAETVEGRKQSLHFTDADRGSYPTAEAFNYIRDLAATM